MKIAIDDGHGMETAGKRTPAFSDGSVMRENEFNRAVVAYLHDELIRNGFSVVLTAPEDTDTSLATRVQRANDAHADYFVSVHANAFGNGWNDANGVESFVYALNDAKTTGLARCIQHELVQETGLRDRGVKENPTLYVLRKTTMPAVLCECGFMTNEKEAKLLKSDAYRKKFATSICKGICAFVGKVYQEEKSPVVHGPVIIENRTEDVDLILWEGRNYLSARDVGEMFGYDVSFKGSTPIFTKKK